MQGLGLKFTRFATIFFALLFGAALLAAPAVFAQSTPPKQQPAPKPATGDKAGAQPGAADSATPPVNKEEDDAYKAIFDLKAADSVKQIQLAEEFLPKYPTSHYRDAVYARLTTAYQTNGQMDKMFVTGNNALAANPDNVQVLSVMAYYTYARYKGNALDAEQILQAMERYARHGLELLSTMTKPEAIAEEDFNHARNQMQSMCHSGLGKMYFFQGKSAESVAEIEQAAKLDPTPDMLDTFVLGEGQARLKKYAEASAAYERCSQTPGNLQAMCKDKAAKMKALAAAQPAPAPAPAQPAAAPAQPAPAAPPDKPKPPRS